MKKSTINQSPRNQGRRYALASRMSDLNWESELGLVMWVGLSWMSCAKLCWVEWLVFSSLGLVSLWWTQFRRLPFKEKRQKCHRWRTSCIALLKGEVRRFFLSAQSFYRPQTKRSLKKQFLPKSPQDGRKSGQKIQNWPNKNQKSNSYCRNPPI